MPDINNILRAEPLIWIVYNMIQYLESVIAYVIPDPIIVLSKIKTNCALMQNTRTFVKAMIVGYIWLHLTNQHFLMAKLTDKDLASYGSGKVCKRHIPWRIGVASQTM